MRPRRKIKPPVLATLIVVAVVAGLLGWRFHSLQSSSSTVREAPTSKNAAGQIETIAQELTVPWGLAVLPEGDLLVTERSGTLRRIGQDNQSHVIQGVAHIGEGGLLGLALDPKFAENRCIYLYMSTIQNDVLTNRIERYSYDGTKLVAKKLILGDIPGQRTHDGGRLAFGPDGFLYVTVGDAGVEELAQDRNSLAGKILRITADGKPAPGNPFGTMVYSYGHRNPQGLAWDNNGQLWSTEHGRSGQGITGYDELNRIKPGANYGWPVIQGDETRTGMERPVLHSGPDETWAPGGLAYSRGSLFFGGLRGETLYEAKLDSYNKATLTAHFRGEYGRLRTTLVSGDSLYLTTSNVDGRGEPKPGDDKIFRIPLSALE